MSIVSRLRSAGRWFRLTRFDTSTEAGRADERHRLIVLGAASSALSKCLALLATFVSIPLALNYLGLERFGIWTTLSGLIFTFQFADLGIGNGIVNTVSRANGRSDVAAMREYISSGAFALILIAVSVLVAGLGLVALLPWESLLKLESPLAAREVRPAAACLVVCMAVGIPLAIVQRVQTALQHGYIANLWQCAANVTSLLAIWGATRLELGLPWLLVALLGAPLMAQAVNSALFFGRLQRALRPSPRAVTRSASREVLGTGAGFLVIQIAVSVVFLSDNLFIAKVLGVAEVARYAVLEKLFSVVTMVLSTLLTPLWPAYAESIARGDGAWVRQTLRRSLGLAALALPACGLLAVCAPWVLAAWVGPHVTVPGSLLVAMAVWKSVEAIGLPLGMFLNGAGVIRFQVLSCCLMAGSILLIKPWMLAEFGLAGAPASTALLYVACSLGPVLWLLPRWLRGVERRPS